MFSPLPPPPSSGSRESSPASCRGRGHPPRPLPAQLEDAVLVEVLRRFVQIAAARHGKKQFWKLAYEATPAAGGRKVRVVRQVSVHEAMHKLRKIADLIGQPVERWLGSAGATPPVPDPRWRAGVGAVAVSIGRAERPRLAGADFYTWRALEGELSRRVRDGEQEGQAFVLAPRLDKLGKRLGVTLRTLQNSLAKIREELAQRPGYMVHVDLWLGDPPLVTGGGGAVDARCGPQLWLSRLRAYSARDAARHGLLPASTPAQAAAARDAIRERWRTS